MNVAADELKFVIVPLAGLVTMLAVSVERHAPADAGHVVAVAGRAVLQSVHAVAVDADPARVLGARVSRVAQGGACDRAEAAGARPLLDVDGVAVVRRAGAAGNPSKAALRS